ncbi:coiled-coil alpha-helical rod protein 1-like [Clavelina lepadiformis]|uniref:coiled-coil alpha-helical rod protein 1-like n=1 Tax=Clavelina lepadiformis TaxID=159417 RepID=UPI004041EB37
MDERNLIPPCHFIPDSLETSPKNLGMDVRSQMTESPVTSKPVLKTPSDFMLPQTQPHHSSAVESSYVVTNQTSPASLRQKLPPTICNDAHRFMRSQSNDDVDEEDLITLAKKLREENKKLKQSAATKPKNCSNASFDVITHQVQYIERLQKDISCISEKIKNEEGKHLEQKKLTQEKELKIQGLTGQLHTLRDQLNQENVTNSKLTDNISELNKQILYLEQEKEQLNKTHIENTVSLKCKHEEETKSVVANFENLKSQQEENFDEERKRWAQNMSRVTSEWEKKYYALDGEYKVKLEAQEKAHSTKKEEILQAQISSKKKFEETESREASLNKTVANLKTQLDNAEHCAKAHKSTIELLQQQISNERDTGLKLKTYIAQIQSNDHAREQWKVDKEHLTGVMHKLEQEKEELIKTLEVLNIRFHSVSKILEMQEEAISAHTKAISEPVNQRKAAVVTTRWRQKVFELMVQCKSLEIVIREDSRKHEFVANDLNSQLEDHVREIGILSNRLQDATAQLALKNHVNQTLKSNEERLQHELHIIKPQLEKHNVSMMKMRDVVSEMSKSCSQIYEANLSKCLERCLRLEQRLAFANNRLRTVQDLLQRRDAKWRARLQQTKQSKEVVDKDAEENPDLVSEILRLTEERDHFSQQLAQDASSFERNMATMKRNEESYHQANQMLEKQVKSNAEKISQLMEVVERQKEKLEDEKYEKENIMDELKKVQSATEEAINEAVEEAKLFHLNELQGKEAEINQAKRELTKAVVALRQTERVSVREKNQFSEQLELERTSWLSEEQKLRDDIRHLQKDNNLLMTTLRQEGLISVFKAARGKPVEPEKDVIVSTKKVHFAMGSPKSSSQGKNEEIKDVNKMLQDLTNLSEKVLADSDSE